MLKSSFGCVSFLHHTSRNTINKLVFYTSCSKTHYCKNSVTDFSVEDRHLLENLSNPDLISEWEKRKGTANLTLLREMSEKLKHTAIESEKINLWHKISRELKRLPNKTCPRASVLEHPEVLSVFGTKDGSENSRWAEEISHHGIETEHLGHYAEDKSYILRGSMARLQHKLIRYAIRELKRQGFTLLSVPDLVSKDTLLSCGAPVDGERTMVYRLDSSSPAHDQTKDDICLSGTAEMGIGAFLKSRTFELSDLPLKLCSVSRCYRVEATKTYENRGLFRVHSFFKVEMFGVTAQETGAESDLIYQELVKIQEKLLRNLGLHGQVILMPPDELGNPAYSKTDIEVWMPGRKVYGELTSASNCTDYQSKRLNTTYQTTNNQKKFVHTINGTAIAMPRCIIALCETHQEKEGRKELRLPHHLEIGSSDVVTEGEVPLEKIMTYDEKCARRYIVDDSYKEMLKGR